MERDKGKRFILEPGTRSVIVAGRRTALQHKVWLVLSAIKAGAPEIVTRDELIDSIWQGNYTTGEKALNQALWAIRSALDDAAKAPNFIYTVPRVGYRWVGPIARQHENIFARFSPDWIRGQTPFIGAGLGVICFLAAVFLYPQVTPASSLKGSLRALPMLGPIPAKTVSHAYFQGRNLIVNFDENKVLILKPSGEKVFGKPLFSEDGWRVAFHVEESKKCKLVMIHLATLDRVDFGACSLAFEQSEQHRVRQA